MVVREWTACRVLNIIVLLVLLVLIDAEDIYDLEDVQVEERPMPPGLKEMIVMNKTDLELALEDCMVDFYECTGIHLKYQLCAINDKNEKKTFLYYCDMIYENCRNNDQYPWHYLHDDEC